MPVLKDIQQVVAAYVVDHDMHPTMLLYMIRILQDGFNPQALQQMSKDEIWGILEIMGPSLEQHLRDVGALDTKECITYLREYQGRN